MNEADTRAELIEPALRTAGWGVIEGSLICREVIAPGRLQGGGGRRSKALACDFVLTYRGRKLAAIEAKRRDLGDTEGVGQAREYARRLGARFAYSTNGVGIYRIDMQTAAEGRIDAYPTPDELWKATFGEQNFWRDRFAEIPFEDKGGQWRARYYQHNAVEAVLEAIGAGEKRILLTLATGTGKTAIAFQIAWKLFQSRWNLSGKPSRRPRILFLTDRNILADQAYNAFSAFADDALVRIDPDSIRRKGRVPRNGSVFFTIFQTFMTGEKGEENYGDYPPDFFDFIVIDECHRGGANDESAWRGIMEYFRPAAQLGLTATPKRAANADTYGYFGEPVYVYSLREGIDDGYLTPFKVRRFATTIDDYTYVGDDAVVSGHVEVGDAFGESDFNRAIVIEEREAYRVGLLLDEIDRNEKTLVFCATQDHAAMIRDLINQRSGGDDPFHCVRVTANDGALGEQHLRAFQDNDKTVPAILTTSRKLSTGVDARNVRNIVLLRPVNSMIEFKQIVGRGTRLHDGKDYFTIYDFVEAHERFNDPDWDGEPAETGGPSRATGRRRARRFRRGASASVGPRRRRTAPAPQDKTRRRQGTHHPAHCGDKLLGAGRQADVGGGFHRKTVRRPDGTVQGRGRTARIVARAGNPETAFAGTGRTRLRRGATGRHPQAHRRRTERPVRRSGLYRLRPAARHAAGTGRPAAGPHSLRP